MDDDSCSKFIGSLTKYLQSLCHSYVDFDNGVELAGHIYLNVDTGKKIDYVLNESVCKNGANVVKFTSNSYHAQPVEKKEKKETPKKDSKSDGRRNEDDDVIIVGSEGSRRNRTPGSSPSRSHASPNQMQRGMGMNRMSPGGMFRSPRGLSPRFGGPAPRPSGYTYQPRQRLTYPQPRNLLTGYSPRMRQPYQPRGAQPMSVRPPSANPVDTDIAFMREEYVAQPGQTASSSANQSGYQGPYPGQQSMQGQQQQQQQQASQMQTAAGQQYGATGMSVPMTAPSAAGQMSTQSGEAGQDPATTDPSLFQQTQPAVSGGMPLPVTTHTIFDSGPVMTPMDLPTSQPTVGEGGSTLAPADPLAAAMSSAGVATDVTNPSSAANMSLDAQQQQKQNLLIGKVWSETNPAPSTTTQAASDQSSAQFPTAPTGESASTADPMQPGTGFDIFNQQPGAQASANQSNPLSQSSASLGVDGDGFSALVSELQAFNQQALPGSQPSTTTSSSTSGGFPSNTAASSSESMADKLSYGVSRTGERVLIKRDPGMVKREREPDMSANIASSVLQESSETAANQGSNNFVAPKGVSGTAGGGMDRKRGEGTPTQSQGGPPASGSSLVGPESVVIETKPFLHQSTDYDAGDTPPSTSSPQTSSQTEPSSQAAPTPETRPTPSTSSSPASSSSSTPTMPAAINVKKERKDVDEAEEETIKHPQSEWQNKGPDSDWVTDMSALNNSDDSMDSDSDTAQDDDDPNYTPGRPLGSADKNSRKRMGRKAPSGQKAPKSPAAKTATDAPQQQGRTSQKQAAPAPPSPPAAAAGSSEDNVVILDSDEEEQQSGAYSMPPNVFIKKEKPDEVVVKKEPVDEYEDTNLPIAASPQKRDPVAAGMKRKVWTDREKDAVQMYFRTYLEEGTLPGKVEIEAVIAAEPSLQARTWHNIKDYLRNAQLATAKRPCPKPGEKGSRSKKRKLHSTDTEDGGEDQPAEGSDEDSDPPLPELPPPLDSDQHLKEETEGAVSPPKQETVDDGPLEGFTPTTQIRKQVDTPRPGRLTERHFVQERADRQKPDCRVCSHRNAPGWKRKQTVYECQQCKIPMCPCLCFELYHTVEDYRKAAGRKIHGLQH
ncbi:hypothetical protein ACOMHN_007832 [Nucella lapillus]